MPEDQSLAVRFIVETGDLLSPGEFLDLFRCADVFIRAIAVQETLVLLEELGVGARERFRTTQRIHQLGPSIPMPAEVQSVRHGSWEVLVTLSATALLWVLKEYVHPVIKENWDESMIRERLGMFIRTRVFRRAQAAAEQAAVEKPEWGNLRVSAVEESPRNVAPGITIRIERVQLFVVDSSEQAIIEDFMRGLEED